MFSFANFALADPGWTVLLGTALKTDALAPAMGAIRPCSELLVPIGFTGASLDAAPLPLTARKPPLSERV
jgi:hypothetical protein